MYKCPKGTRDILPAQSGAWHGIESVMRSVCARYGYREIRTPTFEHTQLFLRGVGETTDIVQKEMYTFEDKGGRSITLKPEGTAGAVRAFIEHGLFNDAQPTKMYYLASSIFRYENPQSGRLREHHQFGIECFGTPAPQADVEVMALALNVLADLKVTELALHINSVGCPSCRPKYSESLREYYAQHLDKACHTCKTRFEQNPLRLLDCKEPGCVELRDGAPVILEFLCPDCLAHMQKVQGYLNALGIEYEVDPYIVRGLDYYTRTVFEILSTHIGSQGTVCGGGRYDGLIEACGGPGMPGVGFGMGMERLLMVLEQQGSMPQQDGPEMYVCPLGDAAYAQGFALVQKLRAQGIRVEWDMMGRSLKAQMKYADKLGARYVAILGDNELQKGVVTLKDMSASKQHEVAIGALVDFLKQGNNNI